MKCDAGSWLHLEMATEIRFDVFFWNATTEDCTIGFEHGRVPHADSHERVHVVSTQGLTQDDE